MYRVTPTKQRAALPARCSLPLYISQAWQLPSRLRLMCGNGKPLGDAGQTNRKLYIGYTLVYNILVSIAYYIHIYILYEAIKYHSINIRDKVR